MRLHEYNIIIELTIIASVKPSILKTSFVTFHISVGIPDQVETVPMKTLAIK